MFSLCRLCAACTDPIELITEMTDLEPKLVHCFGWRRSEIEMEMPKKACNSCVDHLHKSYEFFECMLSAEKQLNKLLSEHMVIVSDTDEILPETVEIKLEDVKRRISDVPQPDASESTLQEYANVHDDHKNSVVEYDDYDDGIFGEPVDYSDDDSKSDGANKNSTKIEPRKRSRKKQPASEPFLDALNVKDRLSNGQISVNGVQKLEKLFPEMKTMSWQDCQYKCDKCNRIFRGSINYYSHIRSVHIEDILSIVVSCFYCNSKHRREFKLNRHITTEHFPHLKYRCPLCPDYYWDPHELVKHRNMHTNLQYTCETCGQAFVTRESFYAHCTSHVTKRKRVPDESFICDICKKHFKSKGSIRNHMLLHTDKYDHVCEQCGWKFQSKGNLKGHLASTHAISKPFQCDKCSKYFKTKHQLKNHSIIHEENYTPFTCTFCDASFRRKSTLKVHMRSHTNVCPYTCRHCGKSFRHGITLQTHERSHTNDKPYGCTNCEYRCTSKGNLNKHMMRAHSIDFRNHKIKKEN